MRHISIPHTVLKDSSLIQGSAPPSDKMVVTIKLKSKYRESFPPKEQVVDHEDFKLRFGAEEQALERVKDFATKYGLQINESSLRKRRVVVEGTILQFESAFNVKMNLYDYKGHKFRGCKESPKLPPEMYNDVESILGLDNRPVAKPHFRYKKTENFNLSESVESETLLKPKPLNALEVATLYNFPKNLDGTGQAIGLIELGGGFVTADLDTYFKKNGLETPSVISVSVLGGSNSPGDPADGEVMLDIEVAGSIAPKAEIIVYFAENTSQAFIHAITDAIHDLNNKISVLSISWGGPENSWSPSELFSMTAAIRDATLLGITVTLAAGDDGDGDGEAGLNVDFPASSPCSLACGGTRLIASNQNTVAAETVWNDGKNGGATGGGFSTVYGLPSYQQNLSQPAAMKMRGVPDVGGNADPDSGYLIVVDGAEQVVGGTSAVAPLWAGLIALRNQLKGNSAGFIHHILYGKAQGAFNQVTVKGNNGYWIAAPEISWNPCVGLGSPNGSELTEKM